MSIKEIFSKASDQSASDIHLVVGMPPFIRIDGELSPLAGSKPITRQEMESLVFSMLTEEQKETFLGSRDFDFGYQIDNNIRFRVNLFYEKNNISLVARIISDNIPDLDEIGLPPVARDLLDLKQGLILVTGPTGCGKSTTLAAMINHINLNRSCNIITLEDPVEYVFHPQKSIIVQRQLGTDMLSFSEGLKHALRQDPNVIMVGEMRDLETIATTITLAETGHLVLATLHTYNAAQTIDRIIDIFPPYQQGQVRMQLSMTLAAVISQRLLAKEGGGRIAAREIMLNSPAVSNLIRENKISQIRTVIETNLKQGMVSLDQDLQALCKKGVITKEIAKMYMINPETLG